MKTLSSLFLVVLALTSCKKKEDAPADPAPTPVPAGSGAGMAGSGSAGMAGSGSAGMAGSGSAAMAGSGEGSAAGPQTIEGFATPESVLVDDASKRYLVSNINGGPSEKDDNGSIAVLSPTGEVVNAKWIDGAADDIKLDAPKGMAISGGVLWVADISVVRKFDLTTGKPVGEVVVPGSTFLNDVVADGDDGIYVTDSALDAKFAPTGTDAVHRISKDGKVKALAKAKDLGAPNGIVVGEGGSVWVSTFGSGELYEINAKGQKQAAVKLPKGQLDGLVLLEGGEMLVTSWEGKAIYRGKPGGEWKAIIEDVESPADIGYDATTKKLLIPLFQKNQVQIRSL